MIREQIMPLWNLLKSIKESRKKIVLKAACDVGKNFRILSDELKDIQEVQQKHNENYPSELAELEQKRLELCRTYAEKTETGEAVTEDVLNPQGRPDKAFKMTSENRELFEAAFRTLRENYKEALDKKEQIEKEFDDFLKSETEVDLIKIKMNDLKNIDFTVDEATILEPILE